jgi:hypothetical protein
MSFLKLVLSLIFFVTAFSAFGYAGWHGHWCGAVTGGLVGIVFGLICGGGLKGGPFVDTLYP